MNEKIFFEWSNDTIITTIVFAVIIIYSLFYLYLKFKNSYSLTTKYGAVAIAIFLVVVDVYLNSMIPLYVTYNESEIRIKQIIGCKRIAYSDIREIEAIETNMISRSTRRMASDGAGGYIGLFNNRKLGNYYMLATRRSDLVLVTTDSEKLVFNCSKRNDLVDYIKEKI